MDVAKHAGRRGMSLDHVFPTLPHAPPQNALEFISWTLKLVGESLVL